MSSNPECHNKMESTDQMSKDQLSTVNITSFPVEILSNIIQYVQPNQADLKACIFVAKKFYAISYPLLLRNINMDHNIERGFGWWNVIAKSVMLERVLETELKREKLKSGNEDIECGNEGNEMDYAASRAAEKLEWNLKYGIFAHREVRHITISLPDWFDQCHTLSGCLPHLPHL